MAANPVEHFIRFGYTHSSYGSHLMDRPTRAWEGTPWDTAGGYTAWDSTAIDADDMATSLVDLMLPFFKPAVSFDFFEIYSTVEPGGVPIVVWSQNFTGKVGTSESTSQDRAWQRTYTLRTTGSWLVKVCLMDTPCGGLVSRYTSLAGLTPDIALVNELVDPANAWSGRADEKPAAFYSLVTQTNKALEKKYGVN